MRFLVAFFLVAFLVAFFLAFFFAMLHLSKKGTRKTHANVGACTRSSNRTLTRLLTPGSSIVMP